MITKFGIEMKLKKKYEQDLNMYKEGIIFEDVQQY